MPVSHFFLKINKLNNYSVDAFPNYDTFILAEQRVFRYHFFFIGLVLFVAQFEIIFP